MQPFPSFRQSRARPEGDLYLGEVPDEDKELARQIYRLLCEAVKIPHQLHVVGHKFLNSYVFLETKSSVSIDISKLSKELERITDVFSVRCDLRQPEKFFIIKFKAKSGDTSLDDLKRGEVIETMTEYNEKPVIHGDRVMDRAFLRQDAADMIYILVKNVIHECVSAGTNMAEFWQFEIVQKSCIQLRIENCCSVVDLQKLNHIVQEYQTKATAQNVLPNKSILFVNLLDGVFHIDFFIQMGSIGVRSELRS